MVSYHTGQMSANIQNRIKVKAFGKTFATYSQEFNWRVYRLTGWNLTLCIVFPLRKNRSMPSETFNQNQEEQIIIMQLIARRASNSTYTTQ